MGIYRRNTDVVLQASVLCISAELLQNGAGVALPEELGSSLKHKLYCLLASKQEMCGFWEGREANLKKALARAGVRPSSQTTRSALMLLCSSAERCQGMWGFF